MRSAIRQLDLLLKGGSTAGLSDGQLLGRFSSSEQEAAAVAFESLVHRHGSMVLATCRGVLRHEQDAEDAFQATFLILARRAGSLRSAEKLGPWLHRVAIRAAERVRVEALRRKGREARWAEAAEITAPGPERSAEREELRQAVHQEIDRLSRRDRAVMVLCDLQGESYETAAERLCVPVGTVRSRLSRARERLRDRIIRRGLALPAGVIALSAGEASAALPTPLVASTVNLATITVAGEVVAGGASTTVLASAQGVLTAGLLRGVVKTAVIVAAVGIGLAGAGGAAVALRGQPVPPPGNRPQVTEVETGVVQPRQVAEEVNKQTRSDAQRIQGRWVIIEAEQFGVPLDLVVGDRLVIEGDRFNWTADRGEPERIFRKGITRGRIAIDPGADPRRIDFIEPQRTIPALYRVESADRLLLCVGDPDGPGRPQSFTTNAHSRQLRRVWRRDFSDRRRIVPAATDPVFEDREKERP